MHNSFPAPGHDHGTCRKEAMRRAEERCEEQGGRLTPLRRRVLELVWRNHRPVGAYLLRDQLAEAGGNPAPMTVYRALEFLLEHGLIHRLQSRNAFVGCSEQQPHTGGHFLVCRCCDNVAEIGDARLSEVVSECAAKTGFLVEHRMLEVEGICGHCQAEQRA